MACICRTNNSLFTFTVQFQISKNLLFTIIILQLKWNKFVHRLLVFCFHVGINLRWGQCIVLLLTSYGPENELLKQNKTMHGFIGTMYLPHYEVPGCKTSLVKVTTGVFKSQMTTTGMFLVLHKYYLLQKKCASNYFSERQLYKAIILFNVQFISPPKNLFYWTPRHSSENWS